MAGSEETQGLQDGLPLDARFSRISAICEGNSDSELYLADENNHAIRKYEENSVTTVAGGQGEGNKDGPIAEAKLSRPASLVFLDSHILLVTESNSANLRKITLGSNAQVQTIHFEHSVQPTVFPLSASAFFYKSTHEPNTPCSLYIRDLTGREHLLDEKFNSNFLHYSMGYLLYLDPSSKQMKARYLEFSGSEDASSGDKTLTPIIDHSFSEPVHSYETAPRVFALWCERELVYTDEVTTVQGEEIRVENADFIRSNPHNQPNPRGGKPINAPLSQYQGAFGTSNAGAFQVAPKPIGASSQASRPDFPVDASSQKAVNSNLGIAVSSEDENVQFSEAPISPRYAPLLGRIDSSSDSPALQYESISFTPYYAGYSVEQLRWLNQTLPSLFPASELSHGLGIPEDDNTARKPLLTEAAVNRLIRAGSHGAERDSTLPGLWSGSSQSDTPLTLAHRAPQPLVFSPSPLAVTDIAQTTDVPMMPLLPHFAICPQLIDLRITNVASGFEFRLHRPILALRNIGSNPRIETASSDLTSDLSSLEGGLLLEKDLKRLSLRQESQKLVSKKEAELRLNLLQTILENSTLPISILILAVYELYNVQDVNFEENRERYEEEEDEEENYPNLFSIPKCLDILLLMSLLDALGVGTGLFMDYLQAEILPRATPEQATEVLYRFFSGLSLDFSDVEDISVLIPNDSSRFIIGLLLQVAVRAPDVASTIIASLESEENALGPDRMVVISSLLLDPGVLEDTHLDLKIPNTKPIAVEWLTATDVQFCTTVSDNGGLFTDEIPAEKKFDLIETGKKLRAEIGAGASDFALAIEGNGPKFIIAQAWLMLVHWPYFYRLTRENKVGLSEGVIVLPSGFPATLLEVIIKFVHGYIRRDTQLAVDALPEADIAFLFVNGVKYGIFQDLLDEPTKIGLFGPLLAKVMAGEEDEDLKDELIFELPSAFQMPTATSSEPPNQYSAEFSTPLANIFNRNGQAQQRIAKHCILASNLPSSVQEQDIPQLFGSFGEIVSVELSNIVFGSRFAIVEFSAPDAKQAALSRNGSQIEGRVILISEYGVFLE